MQTVNWGVSVMNSRVARLLAVTAAATFMASAPAAAAGQIQSAAYSPWAALSAFAAPSSSQALCGMAASNAAANAAAASTTSNGQSGTPGCVLPVLDTPPAPVPAANPVPSPVAGGALPSSFNAIPLLLGLAVLGAAAALALGNGNSNDSIVARPISPA